MSFIPRKKFGQPPVKVACLTCRAARTRCDGDDGRRTCTTCENKGTECRYLPSKRGGPRTSNKKNGARAKRNSTFETVEGYEKSLETDGENTFLAQNDLNEQFLAFQDAADLNIHVNGDMSFDGSATASMVDPGAGLRTLLDDCDAIFDSLFATNEEGSVNQGIKHHSTLAEDRSTRSRTNIRIYTSDNDILDAYYVFIHGYFPILPPPESQPFDRFATDAAYGKRTGRSNEQRDFEPSSPLSLAIAAVLALIPLPRGTSTTQKGSLSERRHQAHAFAQSALESVEIQSELIDSATHPARALESPAQVSQRTRFHPKTPIEYEPVLALLILSVYEYAQRGNIAKMRSRAGQAMFAAMELSLHEADPDDDGNDSAEAKCRAWWMTYTCVCQGSIVSGTPLTIPLHDHRFTTKYPKISSDVEAWSFFIQAQQAIVSATQFIIDLNKALKGKEKMSYVCERMLELNKNMDPLVVKSSSMELNTPSCDPIDASEATVGKALKGIACIKLNSARIKLHRYCAFSDTPIFTRRYCDLVAAKSQHGSTTENRHDSLGYSGCCSQDLFSNTSSSTSSTEYSNSSSSAAPSSPLAMAWEPSFPFSSHFSSKICLASSLTIAQCFRGLPYPNTTGLHAADDPTASFLDRTLVTKATRTMPSFSCCAMQSSYAMLMLCHKAKAAGSIVNGQGEYDPITQNLLRQLHDGINLVLDSLANYSSAFEALGGMEEQIRAALEEAFPD